MIRTIIAGCMLSGALFGCGGGGGGSGGPEPVASTLTFPFKAITDAELARNEFLTGTISGTTSTKATFGGTYTLNNVYTANSMFSYKAIGSSATTSVPANRIEQTSTVVLNNFSDGSPIETSNSVTSYFYDSTGKEIGANSDGITFLTTSGGVVPVSGVVGDRGQVYAQDIIHNGTFASKCGTEVQTYSVEPDSATSVIVKSTITRTITNTNLCGRSGVQTGYARFTQTSSRPLFVDIVDSARSLRITFN